MKYKLTIIVLVLLICLTHGYEKVCLLKPEKIGDGVVLNKITHSTTTDSICALEGVQIELNSPEEQKILDLCANELKSTISLLSVHNGVIDVQPQFGYDTFCSNSTDLKIKLAWIPISNYHQLEKLAGQIHIAKPALESNDICFVDFKTSPPVCRVVGTDSQLVSLENAALLVQRIPMSYVIIDPKPSRWKNETDIKDINLGSTIIGNGSPNSQFIQKNVHYAYEGEVAVKIVRPELPYDFQTTILGDENASKSLETKSYYAFSTNNTYPVVVPLNAYSKVNVTLHGTWVKIQSTISGKLAGIYDIEKGPEPLIDIKLERVDVMVKYIKPIYSNPEPFDPTVTTIVIPAEKPILELTTQSSLPHASGGNFGDYVEPPPDGIYPGTRPFFMVSCTIIAGVIVTFAVDITRTKLKERKYKSVKNHN